MKKLKMLGLAFAIMLVGVFSVNALEAGDAIDFNTGKLSYTKEADEEFAYQFVKISSADFATIETDLVKKLNDLLPLAEKVETAIAKVEELENSGVTSGAEYDEANTKAEDAANELLDAYNDINTLVATVAPYNDANWTDVTGTQVSGDLDVNVADVAADDVLVLWTKDSATDIVLMGEIFTKDGAIDLPTNTPVVDTPTINDNKVTPTKTASVKNPKTGINLPIIAGIGTVVLAGAGIYVVRKNRLFKQI